MLSLNPQPAPLGPAKRSLHGAGSIGLCLVLSINVLGQDLDNSGWLPKTLAEPYSESLSIAATYILTREGCDSLLEAKLSENSSIENPKFILTCAGKSNVTANFVYWLSDINSGFAGERYPEKIQNEESARALSKYEAQLKLSSDNSQLIAACKLKLQELLGDREIIMTPDEVEISQRGDQPVSVNLNYHVGTGSYAPTFSAICRRDSFDAINLRVFSKQ
ncbi:MAG: hypothetical protein ACI95C_002404 [Pseudohongiellaceae bacterium]|jgi:hypothetical protein